MRRNLRYSPAFVRSAKRLRKKQPQISADLQAIFEMLVEDAFHPRLRTHKLHGELEGTWACSAGYDLRIVFEILLEDSQEVIHLLSVGTHDDLY